MVDGIDPEWQGCGVCGYLLVKHELGERVMWEHGRVVDHPTVLVNADSLRLNVRCDFCSREPVADMVLATNFETPRVDYFSSGAWAACTPCGVLIRAEAWGSLVTRVRKTLPAARFMSRAQLLDLYNRLSVHLVAVEDVETWRATMFGPDGRS